MKRLRGIHLPQVGAAPQIPVWQEPEGVRIDNLGPFGPDAATRLRDWLTRYLEGLYHEEKATERGTR
jgi:hypothetical protein